FIEEIVILSDSGNKFKEFSVPDTNGGDRQDIIKVLLESGTWPYLRQRPFNKIASPDETPKSIFISGFDSAPLAPDYNYLLEGNDAEFNKGLEVLNVLCPGKVHLNLSKRLNNGHALTHAKNVSTTLFDGPHPSGNVGVQIHHLDPVITKNDLVWFISPQDLVIIGRLFLTGKYDARKKVAVAGSQVSNKQYYEGISGVNVSSFLNNNLKEGSSRVISGNVLTGRKIEADGYLGFYDSLITLIPEGHEEE